MPAPHTRDSIKQLIRHARPSGPIMPCDLEDVLTALLVPQPEAWRYFKGKYIGLWRNNDHDDQKYSCVKNTWESSHTGWKVATYAGEAYIEVTAQRAERFIAEGAVDKPYSVGDFDREEAAETVKSFEAHAGREPLTLAKPQYERDLEADGYKKIYEAPPAEASKVTYPRYVRTTCNIYKLIDPRGAGECQRGSRNEWIGCVPWSEARWNSEIASGRATLITAAEAGDVEQVHNNDTFCDPVTPNAPDAGKWWRRLGATETVERGDEMYDGNNHWIPVSGSVGVVVSAIQSHRDFRRRSTPEQKPETLAAVRSWQIADLEMQLSTANAKIATLTAKLKLADRLADAVARDDWTGTSAALKAYREGK